MRMRMRTRTRTRVLRRRVRASTAYPGSRSAPPCRHEFTDACWCWCWCLRAGAGASIISTSTSTHRTVPQDSETFTVPRDSKNTQGASRGSPARGFLGASGGGSKEPLARNRWRSQNKTKTHTRVGDCVRPQAARWCPGARVLMRFDDGAAMQLSEPPVDDAAGSALSQCGPQCGREIAMGGVLF